MVLLINSDNYPFMIDIQNQSTGVGSIDNDALFVMINQWLTVYSNEKTSDYQ